LGKAHNLAIVAFLATLLALSHIPSVIAGSGRAPSWARKGVYLTYGLGLWLPRKKASEEEAYKVIESMKFHAGLAWNLTLVSVDDEKGVFEFESVPTGEKTTKEFYWETGWEENFGFIRIYRPIETLEGYPQETLNTSLGVFETYKISRTVKTDAYYKNTTLWFEKYTGVLLLYLRTRYSEEGGELKFYRVMCIPLVETNITWEKPEAPGLLPTIAGIPMVYIIAGVAAAVALAAVVLVLRRRAIS